MKQAMTGMVPVMACEAVTSVVGDERALTPTISPRR